MSFSLLNIEYYKQHDTFLKTTSHRWQHVLGFDRESSGIKVLQLTAEGPGWRRRVGRPRATWRDMWGGV